MADDLPKLSKDKKVAFRASMLPIGNYEGGEIAFPVWPQSAVDAYEALGRFGRGENPQPQDAVLAGLAMAGSGFGGLGSRAAGRALENVEAPRPLTSSPVEAGSVFSSPKEAAPAGMLASSGMERQQPVYRGQGRALAPGETMKDMSFWTDNPERASGYAKSFEFSPETGVSWNPEGGVVYPGRMDTTGFKDIDWGSMIDNGVHTPLLDQMVREAKDAGYPGVAMRNVIEDDGPRHTQYVPFERGRVKSSLDGSTLFSNPREAAPAGLLAASSLDRMRVEDAARPRSIQDAPQSLPQLQGHVDSNLDRYAVSRSVGDRAHAEDPARFSAYTNGLHDVMNPDAQWWAEFPTEHANGGVVLPPVSAFANGGLVKGALHASTGGRTDTLPLSVEAGSYVVPADIVSALGEGNTSAGTAILHEMFPDTPAPTGYAAGGAVPIIAAGGEHVLTPAQVAAVGGGDINRGHEALDEWIKATRKQTIDTLRKLPGPARD